jgi:hypothetical protein
MTGLILKRAPIGCNAGLVAEKFLIEQDVDVVRIAGNRPPHSMGQDVSCPRRRTSRYTTEIEP